MGNKPNWGDKQARSVTHYEKIGGLQGIQVGFVRLSADPQRMGRLTVWIPELGPDMPSSYVTVSYASPFAGATNIASAKPGDKTETGSQRGYGFWAVPPDVGNQVLVAFVNGDLSRGYWIGCIYPQNMTSMVPGMGMAKSTDPNYNGHFSPLFPPSVEYNKKDPAVNLSSPVRPVQKAMADSIIAQGLHQDPQRGVNNSSARREDTSKVHGMLTPGGNSLVFDDDPNDAFVRIRTQSGTQIMVSETSGFIYMITKGGNSWMEISDGAIDVYSSAPISIRSEDDINIRADKNLNLDAGANLNMHASGNISINSAGNVDLFATGHVVGQAGGLLSLEAAATVAIGGSSVGFTATGDIVNQATGNVVNHGAAILNNAGGSNATPPIAAQTTQASSIGGTPPTIISRLPHHEPFVHPINAYGGGGFGQPSGAGLKDSDGNTITGTIEPDNTTVRKISGFKVSDMVNQCIQQAAQKTGVPYANLMAIVGQESAFKAGAGATTSSAKGLFQFVNKTWTATYNKYGPNGTVVKNPTVQNNVYDPCSNALMGAYFYKANSAILSAAGLPTDATSVYAAHFLGPGGAKTFLRGVANDPNGAADASPAAINANKSIFYGSSGLRTNQQVYDLLYSKVGSTVPQWQAYQSSNTGG